MCEAAVDSLSWFPSAVGGVVVMNVYQVNILRQYLIFGLQMSSEAPFCKNFRVTDEVKQSFEKEGFFILRSLFSKEEVHYFQSIKIISNHQNYFQ